MKKSAAQALWDAMLKYTERAEGIYNEVSKAPSIDFGLDEGKRAMFQAFADATGWHPVRKEKFLTREVSWELAKCSPEAEED